MEIGKLVVAKYLLVSIALVSVSVSCTKNSVQDEDIKLMAGLECQARQLKEERFRVANELRLRGDSLMKANSALTERQRVEEDSIKEALTVQTGELATRLTFVMDSLFEKHYKTVEQRETFDKALAKKVSELCP